MNDPVVLRTRRRRQRAIVGVMAAAALAVVGAVQMLRSLAPGVVDVKVTPEDAILVVDGETMDGPPPLSMRGGSHQITATRPGYVSQSETVDVAAGERRAVEFHLMVSSETGLEITSDPEGALIWLDGAPVLTTTGAQAETTYIVTRVRPGKHAVELRIPPKLWKKDVDVPPDRLLKVHGKL
jgi:hypothetical protein